MNFEMLHPADRIVMMMNRIYYHNMTTALGVNLSVRDAEGTVWISPGGVDKGNLRREDIMQIKADGSIVGIHRPSAEYPFHLAIYKKRPDIKAVLHAHPPTVIAGSLLGKLPDIGAIPCLKSLVPDVSLVSYEMPGSSALGDRISEEFARGINAVVLERHGAVIGGVTLFEAFRSFEALYICSQIQRNARAIGGTLKSISTDEIPMNSNKNGSELKEYKPMSHSSEELRVRRELCEFIRRAYEKRFIISENGVFSCRLSDGSVLITPETKDRHDLRPEDIVLVANGKREIGKVPDASIFLHLAIYANDPGIGSVVEALPVHIMAFAVTDKDPDLRLLPETYIALRNIPKHPLYSDMKAIAGSVTSKTPVAMIENGCILATGVSLLKAFDKLEMAENAAKILTEALLFGEAPVGIGSEAFGELERAFNL